MMKLIYTLLALIVIFCGKIYSQSDIVKWEMGKCKLPFFEYLSTLNREKLVGVVYNDSNNISTVNLQHAKIDYNSIQSYCIDSMKIKNYTFKGGNTMEIIDIPTVNYYVFKQGKLLEVYSYNLDSCIYRSIKYPSKSNGITTIYNCNYSIDDQCYEKEYDKFGLLAETTYRPISFCNISEVTAYKWLYQKLMAIPIKNTSYFEGQIVNEVMLEDKNYLRRRFDKDR